MSDIFLSYAHEDWEPAATLAGLLEANGLSVWWDRRLIAGDKFHAVIDEQLTLAKAVVTLWSARSVASDWVLGETQTAKDLNKLVPVKIAECKLPIPYRAFHTPEIYRTRAELDQLARLLSEKYASAAPRSEPLAAKLPEIEFSAESSQAFLEKLGFGKIFGAPCPRCGKPLPAIRKPQSIREFLWGGWTCGNCGCKIDRYGKERRPG